nr:hypothetical protein [Methanofollis formosanus]
MAIRGEMVAGVFLACPAPAKDVGREKEGGERGYSLFLTAIAAIAIATTSIAAGKEVCVSDGAAAAAGEEGSPPIAKREQPGLLAEKCRVVASSSSIAVGRGPHPPSQ